MTFPGHALFGGLFLASLAFGLNNPYLQVPPWAALFGWSAAALAGLWVSNSRRGLRWDGSRPGLFLFLAALTAYLGTFRWHGGDDIPNTLLPFCILRHGTLSMEPFRAWYALKGLTHDFTVETQGGLLSVHPVGPGVLSLPVFAVSILAGNPPEEQLLHNLGKISGSLLCALSVAVVYSGARRRCSDAWAARVALMYGLGTYAFSVASQALWSHAPALLGTALGIRAAWNREDAPREALIGGFGIGLAAACRPDSVFYLAGLAAYWLRWRRRTLAPFLLGMGIPLCLNAAYWLHYGGHLRPPESHYQGILFGGFSAPALWAMLISPTRGMLFLTPAAALGFWGLARALRRGEKAAPFLLAASIATWVFFCFRTTWTAGMTFGNRYFCLVSLTGAVYCAELEGPLRKGTPRALWAAAAAASILIHAIGAYFTWPGSYELDSQAASLWNPMLFPPLNLLASSGALGGLPPAARTLIVAAFAAGAVLLGLALNRPPLGPNKE